MQRTTKIGCEIFVVNQNKILLGKRKNCYGAGDWGLPGGHLEYNEKLIEAASRELKEEVGINDPDLKLFCIVDDIGESDHYVHATFLLENFEGDIHLCEPEKCEEWRFFEKNKLPANIFSPHIKILEAFLTNKQYHH